MREKKVFEDKVGFRYSHSFMTSFGEYVLVYRLFCQRRWAETTGNYLIFGHGIWREVALRRDGNHIEIGRSTRCERTGRLTLCQCGSRLPMRPR